MRTIMPILCAAALSGCFFSSPSEPEPTSEEPPQRPMERPDRPREDLSVGDAVSHARRSLDAIGVARTALDLLGLLPSHACGEPRATFVGRFVEDASAEVACVGVELDASDPSQDVLTLTFSQGCEWNERAVEGRARFAISGGEDRMEVRADLRDLVVDGHQLDAEAGYVSCGDDERVWASGSGALDEDAEVTYSAELSILRRAGIPLFDPSAYVLDGFVEVVDRGGLVRFEVDSLRFEGAGLPVSGAIAFTVDDHTVRVSFMRESFFDRRITVQIDANDPVELPSL